MLRSVLYRSRATTQYPSQAESDILHSAKLHNPKMGVTGYLVRTSMHYVQVLEGPADVLDDLLDIIRADKRHQDLEILRDMKVSRRAFENLSMGYLSVVSNAALEFPNRAATARELAQQMTDFLEEISDTLNGHQGVTAGPLSVLSA